MYWWMTNWKFWSRKQKRKKCSLIFYIFYLREICTTSMRTCTAHIDMSKVHLQMRGAPWESRGVSSYPYTALCGIWVVKLIRDLNIWRLVDHYQYSRCSKNVATGFVVLYIIITIPGNRVSVKDIQRIVDAHIKRRGLFWNALVHVTMQSLNIHYDYCKSWRAEHNSCMNLCLVKIV